QRAAMSRNPRSWPLTTMIASGHARVRVRKGRPPQGTDRLRPDQLMASVPRGAWTIARGGPAVKTKELAPTGPWRQETSVRRAFRAGKACQVSRAGAGVARFCLDARPGKAQC